MRRENLLHRLRKPSELCGGINLFEKLLHDGRTWISEAEELIIVAVLVATTGGHNR
jgi:hypothetical protein